MSTLNVDKVDPNTGTALEIGSSGDTITIPSGATIVNSGTATGFGAALTGSTDNQVTTVTAANAIQGETNLTYDGTILGCGATGAAADLGVGVHIRTADSGASVDSYADELVIEGSGNSGLTIASGNSSEGSIYFADDGDTNKGRVVYYHASDSVSHWVNDLESLKIDSTGAVTKPLQPAFLASATTAAGDQTITNAVNTVVTLGAEIFDQNNDYDGTNTFTAPITGKYQFSGQVGIDAGSGSLTRFSQLNAHITCSNRQAMCAGSGTIYSDANDELFAKGSVLMDMDASDTCTLNVFFSRFGASGTATIVQSSSSVNLNSWLSGYLAC